MYGFVRWLSLALFGGLFLQQAACEQPATDPGAPFMAPPNGCEAMLDTRHAGDPPIKADSPAEGEDADDCPAPDTGDSDAGPANDFGVEQDAEPNPDMGPPLECPATLDGVFCPTLECTFHLQENSPTRCIYVCDDLYTAEGVDAVFRMIDMCGVEPCNEDDPSQDPASCMP